RHHARGVQENQCHQHRGEREEHGVLGGRKVHGEAADVERRDARQLDFSVIRHLPGGQLDRVGVAQVRHDVDLVCRGGRGGGRRRAPLGRRGPSRQRPQRPKHPPPPPPPPAPPPPPPPPRPPPPPPPP